MVWLDGLDMHIVNLMDASFRDGYPDRTHPVTRPEGAADAEVAYNLLPVDQDWRSQTTPIFNYPYARTREALEQLRASAPPDPCHGYKMKYINPVDRRLGDADDLDLDAASAQGLQDHALPLDRQRRLRRGRGHGQEHDRRQDASTGARTTSSSRRAGSSTSTRPRSDAVIFSFSDRVVQEKLDFLREQRGNA